VTAGVVPTSANEFVEQQLDILLEQLEQAFTADALCIVGPLVFGVDDLVRTTVEDRLQKRAQPRDRLVVVLTTNGGYIEAVARMADTLRHHYGHVAFVIPAQAFSAGTVLAMSGDEIWMDYYSRLGPIDPQVETARGRPVPALGYLRRWERLLKKAKDGTLTDAELALMIDGFDQAELYRYEQARELSIRLLKQWLVTYKFKNWTKTQTQQKPVTQTMRIRRAVAIARQLSNTDRWHSHGYGISMEELERDINLRIDDLDGNHHRCDLVKRYHRLLSDYMTKLRLLGIIHTVADFVPTFGLP
jgi:hypothetical protein